MTNNDQICVYCGHERDGVEGWHGCPQSLDAKARIEATIEETMRIANKQAPTEQDLLDDKAWELNNDMRGERLRF